MRNALFFSILSAILSSHVATQSNWIRVTPATEPAGRCCTATAYDLARQNIVLFGGWNGALFGDTWTWDGTNWTQKKPKTVPQPRCCHAMAYDSGRGRIVMFGGAGGAGARVDLNETWEWDGTNWFQMKPTVKPPACRSPSLAYDATARRVILFGGGTTGSGTKMFNDTWSWDGKSWTKLAPKTKPAARWLSAMAFQLAKGRVLLFGGQDVRKAPLGDTWEWSGTDWVKLAPTRSPTARSRHAMAFDLRRVRMVMTGGLTARGYPAETWEFDGTNWFQITTKLTPPGRWLNAMSHDLIRGQTMFFSGTNYKKETFVYFTVSPAKFQTFGAGCRGSAGVPALSSNKTMPWIGETFTLQVSNVPRATGSVIFLLGLSNTTWGRTRLPWNMASLYMGKCNLHVSPDLLIGAWSLGGVARFRYRIPPFPGLLGGRVFSQAIVPDRSAAGGATMSNAGDATIGAR
jgi:Galactose oxidase, central domain